jgi:two-component system cell cycle sensor histidine kinase/response regulator CckA
VPEADSSANPQDPSVSATLTLPGDGAVRGLSPEAIAEVVTRLPVAASLTDPEGRFLAVSDLYCRTHGYDRGELLGRSYLMLVPLDEQEQSAARYPHWLAGQQTHGQKVLHQRKEGSLVQAQLDLQALTLEGGQRVLISLLTETQKPGQSRAALQASEAQYRALIEQSSDAIVVTDRNNRVINWSMGAEQIFGIPREQALGADLTTLHRTLTGQADPPEATALQSPPNSASVFSGAPSRWPKTLIEYPIRRPDGSLRVVQTRAFPIHSGSTFLTGSVTRDVTEARTAERALRRRARQQKRLLGAARYLTSSLELDVVLRRIAEEAKELLEAFGCAIYLLEPGGKVLRPMVAIEPPYEEEILATPVDVDNSFTGQAVKLRRGVIFNDAPASDVGQQIEGTPLELDERVIAAPFIVDGEVIGAMCLSRQGTDFDEEDLVLAETLAAYAATALKNAHTHEELRCQVEERRRAEDAVREREAQFRALAEHSTDIIARFDRSLRHIYANPAIALVTGRQPEEAIGKTYRELGLPEEVCDRWEAAAEEVFRTGQPRLEQIELGSIDGPLCLDWRLVPEFGPEGEVVTVLGTARDISEIKRAETELLESERFLSTLMGNLPGMVYRCTDDSRWTMIYLSEGCRRLTGYAPEDLIANWTVDYSSLIHPQDRDRVREQIMAAAADESTYQLEYRIIDRAGQEKWVWERGRVAWTDGSQSVLEGFIADITDRKRAELTQDSMRAISHAALTCESLSDLCRSIHEIIQTLMPAPNLYVALRDTATGLAHMVYYADEKETRKLGLRRVNRGVTEYILRTGRTLLADRRRLEELNAEGEIVANVAIPESFLGLPLRGHRDEPLGVLAVQSYDATLTYSERERSLLEFVSSQIALALERKQAEEAVREERDFAHNLLNTAQSLVLVLDLEGRVSSYNSFTEALTGCPLEQAKGRSWADDFVPERERDAVRQQVNRLLETGHITGVAHTVIDANGQEHPVEWHGARLSDGQGNVVGLLVTGHDMTEHRRLEEQLLQSQKMETIGRLAGGVAHDFNNLLTAITGHAQFALDGLPVGDPSRDDLQQVLRAADRAASLTRQLLAFSRRQIIEPRAVDLGELVRHTEKMLRRLIAENIELVTAYGDEPCVVLADPAQMEQVLVNLVVNAREAMPDGGRLEIDVKPITLDSRYADEHMDIVPGDYVQLSVTDTGTGMTDEVKAHLFEPFYTTKGPDKGTGLGLATVYGIVRQHQGTVWVYSEVGKGSTFKVFLPRVGQTAERLPRRDEAGFLPTGTETVLVVEDEPLVRKVVARSLREQGYNVLQAADGLEALEVAQRHNGAIHLLITDVIMPQMGGKDLADRLRQVRPEMAVLFVSGYTDSAIVHDGVLEEGTAFLQKPFSVAALARKAREVLDTQRRWR